MRFKDLAIGGHFNFNHHPQLDFDIGKVYRKISFRKYQHVGFESEKTNNVKPDFTYQVGTIRVKIREIIREK